MEKVVAERFHIEGIAGKGGMGTVFRARDAETGGPVALKVVHTHAANQRFEREAKLLAALDHPGIVRYVAHGAMKGGRLYLAMEWLAGVPLDEHLSRGALGWADSLAIGRTLARALGVAHHAGIVHRDVKPSNIMLRGGNPNDAVLVDFGIARSGNATRAMTATGMVIGTPGYMAPEQARGEPTVDARADVFSLGCVLFECLCGRPTFMGEQVIAVLAKILFEPAPRLRSVRPDAPKVLDDLVAAMLEKSPQARPKNGTVIADRIDAIASVPDEAAAAPSTAESIGVIERRFATVLLARPRRELDVLMSDSGLEGITDESVILEAASVAGMTIVPLANGMFVGAQLAEEAGADAANRAARCALALATRIPEAVLALATGRAIVAEQVPVGDAIDRAANLLAESSSAIRIDETTASLIEARYEVARDPVTGRITLVRERDVIERRIMGRVVPFVGRERELALLEATYAECVDEPVARATIMIAPPGTGKTRLQSELVTRLTSRSDGDAPPSVWIGRADPGMARAPLALAGDVARRVLGLTDDEPIEKRREKILARVRRLAGDRGRPERIAFFLGELAGVPFDDASDPTLRAARQSPDILASQIDDAFVAFANGELERSPVVVVLEDIHWADAASLRLFATVFSRSRDRPLMLFALGRPGLDVAHPRVWEELRCQRVILEPLLRKASEKLARAVLGDHPEVDAIVRRAEGNALFVEELARACAAGRGPNELPPTVVAATEARLATFDADTRHSLRAAAVFGERFWRGGVAKLLGRDADPIDARLARLEELELVSRSSESRFVGEREYVFQHAIVRDAAYAMLTDQDRRLGHALAADWLEEFEVGDEMADVLSVHFDSAGLASKAARSGRRAAGRAIRLNRFTEGLALLERTKGWLDSTSDRAALIELLLEQERVGDLVSDRERQKAALDELLSILVPGRDDADLATVHARYGELLAHSRQDEGARASLERAIGMNKAAGDLKGERVTLRGMAFVAWHRGSYEEAIGHNERTIEIARELGEPPVTRDVVNLCVNLVHIGELSRARTHLDELAERRDLSPRDQVHSLHCRALYHAKKGDIEAELATLRAMLAVEDEHGLWVHKIISLETYAAGLRKSGAPAEEVLDTYVALVQLAKMIEFKPQLARALFSHGDFLAGLGRVHEALPLMAQSIELWCEQGDSSAALDVAERAARAARTTEDDALTQQAYERAAGLAERAGDAAREGALRNTLGILHYNAKRYAHALEAYERALVVFESIGDRVHVALTLNSAAASLNNAGEHTRARERLERSIRLARETGERLLEGHALALIADTHHAEGALKDARDNYEESLRIRRDLGDRRGEGWMLQKIAALRLAEGHVEDARKLRDAALLCAEAAGDAELTAACTAML